MNFFERQERARRNSRLLLVFFAAGMVFSVAAIDVAAMLLWHLNNYFILHKYIPFPAVLHALVIPGCVAFILFVSVKKTLEVRKGGGMAIAQMMDARQIVPLKATPLERRLLNIVQEMAIASGTRVPIAYVLDDFGGINAFAAGFDRSTCVIVVTRGALERLNRDELQGVVGHEFSHIVNGDMAFNLRMIGILSGLLVIGAAGETLMREAPEGEGLWIALSFLVGLVIFVAGYSGLFVGRVIKAMIAREREYLADAGSVQFTRHPEGLAGALDQVHRCHSTVLHPNTEEVSHLFFAEAVYLDEERILSTHPPLQERMKRLAPSFKPQAYLDRRIDPIAELDRSLKEQSAPATGVANLPATAAAMVGLVGSFEDRDVRAATALVNALPPGAHEALHSRDGAAALAIALIHSSREPVAEKESAALRAAGFDALAAASWQLRPVTESLPMASHLPVADLALAELMRHPESYRRDVVRALETVIDADQEVSVYRYACLNLMRSQLAPVPRKPGTKSLAAVREDVILMLSLMAYAGCRNKDDFGKAFDAGVNEMELGPLAAPAERERCDAHALTQALERLEELAPLQKARLVRGLYAAVTADGNVGLVEIALMRMMGAVLDCPLPLGPQSL